MLSLDPDDLDAVRVRTDLATAHLYQRQVDRAIEIYGAVIASNPDFDAATGASMERVTH